MQFTVWSRHVLLALVVIAVVRTATAEPTTRAKGIFNPELRTTNATNTTCFPVPANANSTAQYNCTGVNICLFNSSVEVVPTCPYNDPNLTTNANVIQQVQTTITVIFTCKTDPWNRLTVQQQLPFLDGTYVPAAAVPRAVLVALNLASETGAPIPELDAILYLNLFERWLIRSTSKAATEVIISRVSNVDGVESIVRNGYIQADRSRPATRKLLQAPDNAPLLPLQNHLTLTQATSAWEITRGSSDVVIGVADTGCDTTHPDLSANLLQDQGATFILGFGSSNITDDSGHGTHVAGILGAVGNNGIGVSGVMQRVSIVCLKIMTGDGNEPVDGSGTGAGAEDSAVQAWHYARKRGVRIINNSWNIDPTERSRPDLPEPFGKFITGRHRPNGRRRPNDYQGANNGLLNTLTEQYTAMERTYTRPLLELQQNGVLMIWSAGNDGSNIDGPFSTAPGSVLLKQRTVTTPAEGLTNLQIIVVNTNKTEGLDESSNFGVLTTDLAAPGTSILSTVPTYPSTDFNRTYYDYLTGTSQAAPIVAGAAGLCLSVLDPCGYANATQIAYGCVLASVDSTGLDNVTRTEGRVNVLNAVRCCKSYCGKEPAKACKQKTEMAPPVKPFDGMQAGNGTSALESFFANLQSQIQQILPGAAQAGNGTLALESFVNNLLDQARQILLPVSAQAGNGTTAPQSGVTNLLGQLQQVLSGTMQAGSGGSAVQDYFSSLMSQLQQFLTGA